MNNRLTKLMALAATLSVIASTTPIVLAGGSSYAFYSHGHSGIVQTGEIITGTLQLNIQTYINENYFLTNQIAIQSIKLSCRGDDVLESANLIKGSDSIATANFAPSTLAEGWYKAVLEPTDLILENRSVYNLSIDLKSKSNQNMTKVVVCKAEVLEHGQLYDGKILPETDYDMLSELHENKAMVVVVPKTDIIAGQSSWMVESDAQNNAKIALTVWGALINSDDKPFQLRVFQTDWVNEGMYNVMLPFTDQAPLLFDIASPRFFTTEEQSYTHHWRVLEMHLYKEAKANGSIGSIQLGRI